MTYTLKPLQGLPPFGPAPLPPRDSRFAPGPAEMCQLAGVYAGQPLDQDWVAEEKRDGIRLLWVGGLFLSREGLPLECAEHLRPEFERLERRCGRPMVFDSEYCEEAGFLATLAAAKRGQGNGKAWLFDGMALDLWKKGGTNRPLYDRRHILRLACEDLGGAGVHLVEQWTASTPAMARERVEKIWAAGGEGIILKRRSSRYARTRSADWLKLKKSLRIEATVIEKIGEAGLRVLYQGSKLRVTLPPRFRAIPLAVGMSVAIEAMEFTKTGALRQGMVVAMGDRT